MGEAKNVTAGSNQLDRLTDIIKKLRGENGCPWDKKQTPQSMTVYLIEEVYELIDAIRDKDPVTICEELGDVLFHILFIAAVFKEQSVFDINDVARVEADKMVRRHPHVFGDSTADSVAQIKQQWHNIKKDEKGKTAPASIMDSVPQAVPPLVRAYRITERAARVGFDWDNTADVMAKAKEELAELESAMTADDPQKIAEEFGDLLFSLVNLGRFLKVHPETALADTIKKFERRFRFIEEGLAADGLTVEDASLAQMDALWEAAKTKQNETA